MGYDSLLPVIQDECVQRGISFAELNHYWTRKWESVKLSFPFATRGIQMYVAESDTWNHFIRRGIPFPAPNPIYDELVEALDQAKGLKVRLCESERDIETIKQVMQIKDALVASKNDTIRQMDRRIRSYEEAVNIKTQLIAQRDECINQAGTMRKHGDNNYAGTDVALGRENQAAKFIAIQEKDEMIEKLEETIRKEKKSHQDLEKAVLRKNKRIKELEKETGDQRSSVRGLERKIRELELAIQQQDITNEATETREKPPQTSELLLRDQIRHKDEQISKLAEDLSAARVCIQSLTTLSAVQNLDGGTKGQSAGDTMLETANCTDPIKAGDSFIPLEPSIRASTTNGTVTRPSDPTWREAAASILQNLAPKKPLGTDKPAQAVERPKNSNTINLSTPKTSEQQSSPVTATPTPSKDSAPTAPKMFTFKSTPFSRRSASGLFSAPTMGAGSSFASPLGSRANDQTATTQSASPSTGLFGSSNTLSTFVCANCGKTGHRSLLCISPCAICGSSEHTRMDCNGVGSETPVAVPSTTPGIALALDERTAAESASQNLDCDNCAKASDHDTINCKNACGGCGTMGHLREQCEQTRAVSAIVDTGVGDSAAETEGQNKRKVDDEVETTEGAKRIKIEEE